MPDYGESPELLETRAKLAAAHKARRGPVAQVLHNRRDAREVHAAYRALFYPDGVLHPAARIVLDDLAHAAGLGAASALIDHGELCVQEGKRLLMLHLLARFRLSPVQIAAFEQELENAP